MIAIILRTIGGPAFRAVGRVLTLGILGLAQFMTQSMSRTLVTNMATRAVLLL